MKKNILLGFLILSTLSCKTQIIPVEQVINHFDKVEEGVTTYIKDVNNVLDHYVGVWKGTYNSKNYIFFITEKTIIHDEEYNSKADILIMKHRIIDTKTGEVIEDTTLVSDEDPPSEGLLFQLNSAGELTYVMDYIGESEKCGQSGEIRLTLFNEDTQMYLVLYPDQDTYIEEDCLNGYAEQVIPTDVIVLTKQ